MNVIQSIKIGLVELKANKLRSFLTMLGVIFGVAAVIASVAIGEGARSEALAQIALMGINNIRVKPLELDGQELLTASQKNPKGLSLDDVAVIKKNCPYVETIIPIILVKEKSRHSGQLVSGQVIATEPDFLYVTNFQTSQGRFFEQEDMKKAARVCVIGAEIRNELFPLSEPIGKKIIIGDGIYVVVGVMEDKRLDTSKSSVVSLRNMNRDIYIPLTTARKRLPQPDPGNELSELTIMIDSSDNIMAAAKLIKKIILRTHGGVENFELIIPISLLKQSQATQKTFNMVLAAIAGISLLVGGIGIMNIMLASVTQRIREIGIRRALGATRKDIMGQFLIEAVVMSIVGGGIGIGFGVLLGYIISFYAKWNTVYSLKAILISFFVAGAVGVIFGLFPARKAARLNPIEALRYE